MNVLVQAYWGIGDLLLQTPAISLLREALPEAQIIHRTMEVDLRGEQSVVYGNPCLGMVDPPRHIEPIDLVVNLGGYQHYSLGERIRYHRDFVHVEAFRDMAKIRLAAAGISFEPETCPDLRPHLYLNEQDRSAAPQYSVPPRPRVVMCRATKGCAQKTWPVQKWQELSKRLKYKGYEVVGVGVGGDFHIEWSDLDFVGKLTFR